MEPKTGTRHAQIAALYAQPDITARGNFSKSHLFNMVNRGQFPRPALRCGPKFTRWTSAEVDAWFADPAGWIAAHAKVLAPGAGESQ